MHRHRAKFTSTRVGACQNGAAGHVGTPADSVVVAPALGDGRLGAITVHSSQSNWQVLKQNLHSPSARVQTALSAYCVSVNVQSYYAYAGRRVCTQSVGTISSRHAFLAKAVRQNSYEVASVCYLCAQQGLGMASYH